MKWISVEDRLPERSGFYLACIYEYTDEVVLTYKIREVLYKKAGKYDKTFCYLGGGINEFTATHWAYKPEPPNTP